MEKSSQIAWELVPLRHFFPLKVVPLIEVLLSMAIPCHKNGRLILRLGHFEERESSNMSLHRRCPSTYFGFLEEAYMCSTVLSGVERAFWLLEYDL
jgi:hypothetical protein